jgi:multiple sugar transport system permease protein
MTTIASSRTGGRRPARRTSSEARRQRVGWLFVAPFGVVFLAFLVVPLGYAFWISLQTKTLVFGTQFSGLANYARAFTDPQFLKGVGLVLAFVVVSIPIQIAIALAAALVLDGLATRFSRFARLMMFVPYAVPTVLGALMWGFLYSPGFGPGAQLFGAFGLAAPNLLGPDAIFGSIVNIVTWQWSGYYMIILYAALQGIDPAVYEAAQLDGASAVQIALRVKVPMISSALVLILVFSIIGTLQLFTEPQILRPIASGALDSSYTPNVYAYNLAFSYNQVNYSSAISFALATIVFVVSYAFLLINRRRSGLSR